MSNAHVSSLNCIASLIEHMCIFIPAVSALSLHCWNDFGISMYSPLAYSIVSNRAFAVQSHACRADPQPVATTVVLNLGYNIHPRGQENRLHRRSGVFDPELVLLCAYVRCVEQQNINEGFLQIYLFGLLHCSYVVTHSRTVTITLDTRTASCNSRT